MDDYDYLYDVIRSLSYARDILGSMNDEYIQNDTTSIHESLEDFMIELQDIRDNIQRNGGEYKAW